MDGLRANGLPRAGEFKMKRLLIVSLAMAALGVGPASETPAAAEQYAGFQQLADAGSMKPFCRDLGGILGSETFHGGRSLGFSGFDVGLRGGMLISPDPNDRILRNNGVHRFGLPWVQAEIGMPFKIDGFIRGISDQGLTIAGGPALRLVQDQRCTLVSAVAFISGVGHSVVHQFSRRAISAQAWLARSAFRCSRRTSAWGDPDAPCRALPP